jgi:hypothetical protein
MRRYLFSYSEWILLEKLLKNLLLKFFPPRYHLSFKTVSKSDHHFSPHHYLGQGWGGGVATGVLRSQYQEKK